MTKSVAIVGMGPSYVSYLETVEAFGNRKAYVDETWVLNSFAGAIEADLVFHMDDVRIQEKRALAGNKKIEKMLEGFKDSLVPVMTSREHIDYPALVAYPLEKIANRFGALYFDNTAAYAIAFAIYQRFDRICLFGIDFTYPGSNQIEEGKACCEYWLGRAREKGVQLEIPQGSTLLNTHCNRLYGYDTLDVEVGVENNTIKIAFSEKPQEEIPTAEQIEKLYDHSPKRIEHVKG